jgi:hypothetical protein
MRSPIIRRAVSHVPEGSDARKFSHSTTQRFVARVNETLRPMMIACASASSRSSGAARDGLAVSG